MCSSWRGDTCLYGDAGAALGAAGIDNRASTGSLHSNQKAMGFLASGNGGLIGTFHNYSLRD